MELVKYEAACLAVAQAKTIDEVREITNRAEALRAYARQAKNRTLEIDAVEIRIRAERRLGEMLLVLRADGQIGQGRGGRPMRLRDIGVDLKMSGGAQRLAKLADDHFESELTEWRDTAETSQRLEAPLQRYRKPSVRGDRQRAAVRFGRVRLDQADPLDRYRSMDGRRIADWRHGELDRIEQVAGRVIKCVEALRSAMPMANPDPLDTMEMIYRTSLGGLLASIWDEVRLPQGNAGNGEPERVAASLLARQRTCQTCGHIFTMRKLGDSKGLFCSRACVRHPTKDGAATCGI